LVAAKSGRAPATVILPTTKFYVAEDYHQKYYLRQSPALMREFAAMYPQGFDFMNSTAAARANGYIGGHGSRKAFEEEKDSLGLSESALGKLRGMVRR
jgi:peptide-methionine (S)-S-oxide reductase